MVFADFGNTYLLEFNERDNENQGTMNDMVLDALEPALLVSGINSLRFNFRGVGGSEGVYGDGVGD